MIADWPTRIVSSCPDRKEAYITGTIHLERLRAARKSSRNFAQRRPDLYRELIKTHNAATGEEVSQPHHE